MDYRRVRDWVETHRDVCFDILRIYLGFGLMVKGALFASNPELLSSMWEGNRMLAIPAMLAHYVVAAHLCGGFLMAIGLLTRTAAAVQIPVLLDAVFFVHSDEGLFTREQNLEFTVLVLFLLVLVAVHGAGRWSVDHYLFRKVEPRAGAATGPRPVGTHSA